jgi:hypothetical protein
MNSHDTRKEAIMSNGILKATTTTIALVLSTGWLYGCGGNVTADDRRLANDDRAYEDRANTTATDGVERRAEAGRSAEKRASFFDRLLGDRTREVTVPAGTTVMLRWSETLSSRANSVGDAFRTTVDQDVRIGDDVAIPAGSVVIGRVTEAHQPQKVGGRARLSLEFTSVELPSGESVPLDAVFAASGKSQNLKDAGIIAGSTVGGAILGEAIEEGEGGVIGGILGGVGGAIAASRNKSKAVEVPAGTVMAIELVRPATLEVPA